MAKQVIIEDPILNSAFEEPRRHFKFTEEGITNEVVESRRVSAYFVPVPRSRKRGPKQTLFDTEWTEDRLEENKFINEVRSRVSLWRRRGWPGVTKTTARLLEHWTRPDRDKHKRLFFCQIEAAETAIYIMEAASKFGDAWIENRIREANDRCNPGLYRIAFKMATGSGKTVVMSMLIAWQALNKFANLQDARFTDSFLVVTPGITIRDRLRVLLPNDPDNYYRKFDTVPGNLREDLHRAHIVITNFHQLMCREKQPSSKLTKEILAGGGKSPFKETPDEMDASIARHSEQEILYDQPYEDNKRVRVSGPFTVESLSPHRRISVDEKKELAEVGRGGWKVRELGPNQFGHIVTENLKASGVSNRAKGERLKFDRLEPYAGMWIHAEGEYTEKDGRSKRVAVCIGPEHGTVGPQLVKEAAKEAVQGIGFDTLVVCGFSFDPHVSEEVKRYGKLTVLPAEIDKDLQLGGDYLKKRGSASLFTVYAEPDVQVQTVKGGKVQVEIKGLDVYDPTTGEIRSNSTDDIACWFIDTDYNGESFFVRHAYFSGADDPYEKLRRTLRAEVHEAAWASLYSTVSRPFDKPETGKIAIKVINHYGDEVLKVYDVK